MAWFDVALVTCKNKLCDSKIEIRRINGNLPDPLPPCPKCGFKTLDQYSATTAEVEAMAKVFKAAMEAAKCATPTK